MKSYAEKLAEEMVECGDDPFGTPGWHPEDAIPLARAYLALLKKVRDTGWSGLERALLS